MNGEVRERARMKWLEGMGRGGKEVVLKWTNGVREGMGGKGG